MKQSLKSLVIDTATSYLYIALFDNDQVVEEIYQKGHNDHSVTLMDELQKMFSRHELKPSAIDRIIVGVGPGSYTGVRVGVVVAKMLGYSLHKQVYTISSLALLASASKPGIVMAWIDARRKHGFIGMYKVTDDNVERIEADIYTALDRYRKDNDYDFEQTEIKPNMEKLFHSGLLEEVQNIHQLAPMYLRKTEAEKNFNIK
ncbi:MAG: tRNA (adenosine(37)-N6)-threonylcarbamoyltransferase complex dimerization subunit type 1 TsaB [Bacillota bacterium]